MKAALIISAIISTAFVASAKKPYSAPRTLLSAARAEEQVIEEYVKEILPADPSFGRRR